MTDAPLKDATSSQRSEGNCYVALTHDHLDILATMNRIRSPKAGALVLFAGTTRDNFSGKPVVELSYSAYKPKALRTMLEICQSVAAKHALTGIAMVHRLGAVPVGEESVLIAVASPHRGAAWRAGEEALEECKARVEVWKREEFGGEEGGVWRANRDGVGGAKIDDDDWVVGENRGGSRDGRLGLGEDIVRPGPPVEKGHGAVVHPQG